MQLPDLKTVANDGGILVAWCAIIALASATAWEVSSPETMGLAAIIQEPMTITKYPARFAAGVFAIIGLATVPLLWFYNLHAANQASKDYAAAGNGNVVQGTLSALPYIMWTLSGIAGPLLGFAAVVKFVEGW